MLTSFPVMHPHVNNHRKYETIDMQGKIISSIFQSGKALRLKNSGTVRSI